MAIIGFLGVTYVVSFNAALNMIGADMWNIFSNYGLTVIPMFILVGEFVHYAGYNDGLYYATYRWFAITRRACHYHHHGVRRFFSNQRQQHATAATMSQVAIPAMKKYNYHRCSMQAQWLPAQPSGCSYRPVSCSLCTGCTPVNL